MKTTMIQNPILRGFYPDPSICRVGEDYYIATSTFEWFPGVAVHHSRDLVHWRPVGHILTRRSQLDLQGIADSGGVWAPSLTWADGQFWLVYSVVRTRVSNFKDVLNFLVTAPSIDGPWSEPIFLNAVGFDASLYHDTDGRKWLVQIQWDFRKEKRRFAGIVLQEYDPATRNVLGLPKTILRKPALIEGPNLYKRNGYYYLMLAEGGTGWNHGISMARARSIEGPYELDPQEAVMTARDTLAWPLQKAGHGEWVETPKGETWLVHLCSRPVPPERRCILGRETALQRVVWSDDGWLRLAEGGTLPQVELPGPAELPSHPWPTANSRDDFDQPPLGPQWQMLRRPADPSWISFTDRPGWLRLRGRESTQSLFEHSLIAQRLTSLRSVAETRLDFSPDHFTQMAGLVCWYDTLTHYYLRATWDEQRGKILGIIVNDDGNYDELSSAELSIGDWSGLYLRVEIDVPGLQFSASPDGINWITVGPVLDATKLSDDYGRGLHFTGAFVGICAQDINGGGTTADFDYFELKTEEEGASEA